MLARLMTAAVVALLMFSAPASAADSENLQLFRDVQRQVLRYPHFTIFDSVHANVNDGHVTLVGKVTMPYKKTDIEKRVANVAAVTSIDNQIEVTDVTSAAIATTISSRRVKVPRRACMRRFSRSEPVFVESMPKGG